MRAYIPPERYRALAEDQKQQWDTGTVARILRVTGIPIIAPETIPLICYRMNQLQYADVSCKIAQGMQPAEVEAPAMITPEMLYPFVDGVVDGAPFETKSDEEFLKHMHHKMAQFMLPTDRLLEWHMKVSDLMKAADAELEDDA